MANANTEGFSRQDVLLVPTEPYTMPSLSGIMTKGQIGTGVQVDMIRRIRDLFLDFQIRNESTTLGEWSVSKDTFDQIQVVFNEPSDDSLGNMMTRFWNSWQALSQNPQSSTTRSSLREQANSLTFAFNHAWEQLSVLQRDTNELVYMKVQDINGLASQIASLNDQIATVQLSGNQPNDLKDQRDLLLDKLSKIINVSYRETSTGSVTVNIGGKNLVSGTNVNQLVAQQNNDPTPIMLINPAYGRVYDIRWADDSSSVYITGGEIKGYLNARDSTLPQQTTKLNDVATGIISNLNAIHQQGFGLSDSATATLQGGGTGSIGSVATAANASLRVGSWAITSDASGNLSAVFTPAGGTAEPAVVGTITAGATNTTLIPGITLTATNPLVAGTDTIAINGPNRSFFSGANASDMALSADILSSTNNIAAAAASNSPGDARKGLAIALLQRNLTMSGNTATFSDYYQSTISGLGVEAQRAESMMENQNLLVGHLATRKESISGVSLDEEATNLVRFQRAYQAAARVVTTVDEMLDKIINGMGIVGR